MVPRLIRISESGSCANTRERCGVAEFCVCVHTHTHILYSAAARGRYTALEGAGSVGVEGRREKGHQGKPVTSLGSSFQNAKQFFNRPFAETVSEQQDSRPPLPESPAQPGCSLQPDMDFREILLIASKGQGVNHVPKRYSLAVGPPKKDPKVKGVQSAAVQAFLRRKEEELRRKALEEKKKERGTSEKAN